MNAIFPGEFDPRNSWQLPFQRQDRQYFVNFLEEMQRFDSSIDVMGRGFRACPVAKRWVLNDVIGFASKANPSNGSWWIVQILPFCCAVG
jgi:hypothetical protein